MLASGLALIFCHDPQAMRFLTKESRASDHCALCFQRSLFLEVLYRSMSHSFPLHSHFLWLSPIQTLQQGIPRCHEPCCSLFSIHKRSIFSNNRPFLKRCLVIALRDEQSDIMSFFLNRGQHSTLEQSLSHQILTLYFFNICGGVGLSCFRISVSHWGQLAFFVVEYPASPLYG